MLALIFSHIQQQTNIQHIHVRWQNSTQWSWVMTGNESSKQWGHVIIKSPSGLSEGTSPNNQRLVKDSLLPGATQ